MRRRAYQLEVAGPGGLEDMSVQYAIGSTIDTAEAGVLLSRLEKGAQEAGILCEVP